MTSWQRIAGREPLFFVGFHLLWPDEPQSPRGVIEQVTYTRVAHWHAWVERSE